MLNYIYQTIVWDKDLPYRSRMIDLYTRIYNGTIYDHLKFFFFQERQGRNYIPINKRQPSVKTRFCKIVADNSVSLLFGSDHFPEVMSENKDLKERLTDIITEYKLNKIMLRAATIGSTGSVIVFLKVFEGVLKIEPKNTMNIYPIFDNVQEDKLIKVVEKYKVPGKTLIEQGYDPALIEFPTQNYWFIRDWTETEENYYLPILCKDYAKNKPLVLDVSKSTIHNLGFVPAIWIRNLPAIIDHNEHGAIIDGACTFEPAIDTSIEVDYQLSQAGRALKYSSDPLLVLKLADDQGTLMQNTTLDGSGVDLLSGNNASNIVRSSSNAVVIGAEDEAKLLEISGDACTAVREYVRDLREYMIESISGNRSNADKIHAAASGKAMEAMNQALIWLADHLRISYGECGLLKILQMIIAISNVPGYGIMVDGKLVAKLDQTAKINLKWPDWYPNTPAEKVQNATALKSLTDSGLISKQTGIKNIADNYAIEDVAAEEALIAQDQAIIDAKNPKLTQIQNI